MDDGMQKDEVKVGYGSGRARLSRTVWWRKKWSLTITN